MYVFANQFAVGMPAHGSHIMIKSFDGGKTWTRPRNIGSAVDTCFSEWPRTRLRLSVPDASCRARSLAWRLRTRQR